LPVSLRQNPQMKAIVLEAFGGPEKLVYRLINKPHAEPACYWSR